MDCRLEDMTMEEIFCAEAGITSDKEYDEYIEKMIQDYEAAEATRDIAVDYGKYDCAGFDLSNH